MNPLKTQPLSLLAGAALTAGVCSLMGGLQETGDSYISGDVREFLSHVSMVDLSMVKAGPIGRSASVASMFRS